MEEESDTPSSSTNSTEGEDDAAERPSSSLSSSLLSMATEALRDENGTQLFSEQDLLEALRKSSTVLPFVFLLLARFLAQYLSKFFTLVFLITYINLINTMLNEQLSFKGSGNKKLNFFQATLYGYGMLILLLGASSSVFDIKLFDRLILAPYHPHSYDFLSVLWLCMFSDLTLQLAVGSIKFSICFLHAWRGSCLQLFEAPSMIPRRLFLGSILSTVGMLWPARSGQSTSSTNGEDESTDSQSSDCSNVDIEAGTLLGAGSRRRVLNSSRQESRNYGRALSADSEPSISATIEHHYKVMAYVRLNKIFYSLDSLGYIYRSLVPLPVWLFYFSSGPGSSILPLLYLFFKLLALFDNIFSFYSSFKNIFQTSLECGRFSTDAEIEETGSPDCSICFERYYRPITLECKHIFCERCINEWLVTESTCPVCRAQVDHSSRRFQRSRSSLSSFTTTVAM